MTTATRVEPRGACAPGVALAAVASLLSLAACASLGPAFIDTNREGFADTIQRTTQQQVFANIIRVANHEMTFTMDISEVIDSLASSASLTAGVTGLGTARGGGVQAGSVAGTAGLNATPTVHYAPLLGAALVQQLTTPISASSLTALFNSDWNLAPVLGMAVDRISPGFEDYFSFLNAVIELDQYGAPAITTGRIGAAAAPPPNGSTSGSSSHPSGSSGSPGSEPEDSLVLALRPYHPYLIGPDDTPALAQRRIARLWLRLLSLQRGPHTRLGRQSIAEMQSAINAGQAPDLILGQVPSVIQLAAATKIDAVKGAKVITPPVLNTRSALGILKAATEAPGNSVEFVPRWEYTILSSNNGTSSAAHWAFTCCCPTPGARRRAPTTTSAFTKLPRSRRSRPSRQRPHAVPSRWTIRPMQTTTCAARSNSGWVCSGVTS